MRTKRLVLLVLWSIMLGARLKDLITHHWSASVTYNISPRETLFWIVLAIASIIHNFACVHNSAKGDKDNARI